MALDERRGTGVTMLRVAVSLIAGIVVVLLLFPALQFDTLPPQCWSVFDYRVTCGERLSLAAGAATAAVVGLAFWFDGRRRKHRR